MSNTLNLGTDGNWATKEDSLLAYNSENGNFKPLPFDFTRASSATVVNKAGLIETVGSGEPRIDFSNDAKGALLLEPTRSNLLPYSEDFSIVNWSKYGSGTGVAPTVTSNYAISPDGTLNASRVQFDKGSGITGSDMSILNDNVAVTSGITTSKSVYVKSNTSEEYDIVIYGASSASGTNVKKVRVTSQWQRFDVYGTIPSTTTGITIGLREIGVTGLSNTADVSVWGAQLEQGSYATSYIPTQGGVVTRVLEISEIYNLDDYVSSETSWTATGEFIKGQDKDNSLYISFAYHLASSNLFRIRDFANYVSFYLFTPIQSNINYSSSLGDTIKWAIRAKSDGSYSVYVDGVSIAEANGTFQKLDKYNINGSAKNKIKDLRVYNTALTDAELSSLTTI